MFKVRFIHNCYGRELSYVAELPFAPFPGLLVTITSDINDLPFLVETVEYDMNHNMFYVWFEDERDAENWPDDVKELSAKHLEEIGFEWFQGDSYSPPKTKVKKKGKAKHAE